MSKYKVAQGLSTADIYEAYPQESPIVRAGTAGFPQPHIRNISTPYIAGATIKADDMNDIRAKLEKLEHLAGCYKAIVICQYCGQHTANFAPCFKCGAPIGNREIA